MKHYNIAFVGMGSIGKRHLLNVTSILQKQGNTFRVDLYRSSMDRLLTEDISALASNQYLYDAPITCKYDIVFITNPTALHLQTAIRFRDHAKAMFIEKPVFSNHNVDDVLVAGLDEIPSYVACPLHYNPVLQYVKQHISVDKVISVRAMSSSYLPDWRPGQDYRLTYSAHKQMGGGVDIDLIHEWDYLTWIFGIPTECYELMGKLTNLEIDSNDTALYIARNASMTFELHLDYFGRQPIRTLDIFTYDDTIHCDLLAGTVSYLKEGRTLTFNCERNAYQMEEIQHFLNIVEGNIENDSNVAHAVNVIKLTQGIIKPSQK